MVPAGPPRGRRRPEPGVPSDMPDLRDILLILPGILFGFTIHEFAHAYVAYWFGDDTAERQGRLTLNPLAHLDPIGTLLILFAGFGWARPVPVDARNFKNPRWDDLRVTAAGPLSNLVVALLFGFGFRLIPGAADSDTLPGTFKLILLYAVHMNLILCFFNLLPIFPLDGARIVARLLPLNEAYQFARLEPMGPFILMGLLALGQVTHFSIFGLLIGTPVALLRNLLIGA